MLSEKTHAGMSTFFNGARRFPGQIDGSGRNLIETLDDPGDITNIEFQQLTLDDAAQVSDDDAPQQQSLDANSSKGHSLAITITVRPKGKTREQLYYCAIMKDQLSVDNKRSTFTRFNLVFLKAPVTIGQLVMQWLERKFDCRICRLVFQSYELRSIVDSSLQVMYNHAQGRGDKKERPIELHYSFPESVDTLKNMSVSLPVEDARQLLVSRNDGSNAGLLEGIEAHCADTMMIDFGRLVLTRAGCSSWYIASEGKAKIFPVIAERHSVADFIREIGKCGT
ncbi:MAG: kinetochore complex Sim4 subunit Fta1-domain-containing protein [Benniella sp.]|nr:MAG: kinetochore complex Sim4 subunit Fta1-domain-containing protein [Benniella sp.]